MAITETWFIGDFLTGARLHDLEISGGSWARHLTSSSISVSIPWGGQARRLAELIRPWTHYLGCDINGTIVAAGPIMTMSHLQSQGLIFHAQGAEVYLSRREVLPRAVKTNNWVLYDQVAKQPASYARSNLQNYSWPRILSVFTREALAWAGSPPITAPGDNLTGTAALRIEGIEHRSIREMLNDVAREQEGIEWTVSPYWSGDGRVWWRLDFGTPLIGTTRSPSWEDITDFALTIDGRYQTTHQHMTGRTKDGEPISVTSAAPDGTYPLMLEDHATARLTETTQARLQRWANEQRTQKTNPTVTATLTIPAVDVHLWDVGDHASLTTADQPWITNPATLRVMGRQGTLGSPTVQIETIYTGTL